MKEKENNNLKERIESEGFGKTEPNNEPPEYIEEHVGTGQKKD